MTLKDDHDDSSADESDNETLLAFKNRKSRKHRKIENQTRSSNEITPGGSEDNTERNETSPHVPTTEEDEELEIDVHISVNVPSASSPEDTNIMSDHELEDDELADSGNDSEAGGVSLTQSPLSRRKLKMVLDDEDD